MTALVAGAHNTTSSASRAPSPAGNGVAVLTPAANA
jgi:hypothetical protein